VDFVPVWCGALGGRNRGRGGNSPASSIDSVRSGGRGQESPAAAKRRR
jgi:hypothetical protein